MSYQTLKYVFIRAGLSFLLMLTFGFFTLYFIHEVALPRAVFDDSLIQWLLLFVCLFFGFFAYGMIGDQRFHNAMHELKNISYDSDSSEIIDKFQSVLGLTYSSYFLPGQAQRFPRKVARPVLATCAFWDFKAPHRIFHPKKGFEKNTVSLLNPLA